MFFFDDGAEILITPKEHAMALFWPRLLLALYLLLPFCAYCQTLRAVEQTALKAIRDGDNNIAWSDPNIESCTLGHRIKCLEREEEWIVNYMLVFINLLDIIDI